MVEEYDNIRNGTAHKSDQNQPCRAHFIRQNAAEKLEWGIHNVKSSRNKGCLRDREGSLCADSGERPRESVFRHTNEGIKKVGKVRVTDIERTIVDSIKDFSKIGGLEELLRCLAMVTYATEDKLIKYLKIYDNQFLWQKTGYILSCYPNMKLSEQFFETCKTNSQKSVRYLYEELKYENPVFSNEWGLYIPNDIMKLLDEGGESLV